MEEPPRRVRKTFLFMLVCALHGVLGWYLLTTSRVITSRTQWDRAELILITLRVPLLPEAREKRSPGPPPMVPRPGRRHSVAADAVAPANDQRNAITTPPVDWSAELARAGRAATAIDSKNSVQDFSIPHRAPPTMADYPEFDWDYARTHRVESIPTGGVIIHLNDNCVLILSPLPFAACSPFKHKANGELFKHMHDPDRPGDPRAP